MSILYIATLVLLALSLLRDRAKTLRALRIGARRFLSIAPDFVVMLVVLSIALAVVPDDLIARVLAGENRITAMAGATALGSVAIMPGFIAFPLCGILREQGALYMVLSAFSTTLMMVGVATFPLEQRYLGTRLALWRNVFSLGIAVLVAIATGFVFGEIQ